MKANLLFDLPEEQEEFDHALEGSRRLVIIENLQGEMRKILKYEERSPDYMEAVERLRHFLLEEIQS